MSKAAQAYKSPQTETQTPNTKKTETAAADELTALKNKIVKEFGVVFGSEHQFVVSKMFSVVFSGLRFCFERSAAGFETNMVPISKKSGLLKPGYLQGRPTQTGRMVHNLLTNKPALNLVRKEQIYIVQNAECNNVEIGSIHVKLEKDLKKIVFLQDKAEVGTLQFKLKQPSSIWCCAARVPPGLFNIELATVFKSHKFVVEENPNGEDCRTSLEANFSYSSPQSPPSLTEFLALVCLLEVAAVELA